MASRNLQSAYNIAIKDLINNFGPLGIYAGNRNHREYWARDSFFASLGLLSDKRYDIVRKNLNLFTSNIREDGHIPARIEERPHLLNLLGIIQSYRYNKSRVLHKQSQPWASDVVDSNSLFLISSCAYLSETKDVLWFEQKKKILKQSAKWLEERIDRTGLLREGYTASWFDASLKSGYVAYSNILCWKAFLEISKQNGFARYRKLAKKLQKAILENFWDKQRNYFIDWISSRGRRHTYFSADANLLAVWWEIIAKKPSGKILNFIDLHKLNKIPIRLVYPKLSGINYYFNKIIFHNYAGENSFIWWGVVLALARKVVGDLKRMHIDMNIIADVIVMQNSCPEVFSIKGKPVNGILYKSENGLTWTAGLYVLIYNSLQK